MSRAQDEATQAPASVYVPNRCRCLSRIHGIQRATIGSGPPRQIPHRQAVHFGGLGPARTASGSRSAAKRTYSQEIMGIVICITSRISNIAESGETSKVAKSSLFVAQNLPFLLKITPTCRAPESCCLTAQVGLG